MNLAQRTVRITRATALVVALMLWTTACGQNGGGAADQPVDGPIDPEAVEADAVWVAEQLAFTDAPTMMPSGDVTLGLRIDGGFPHNVVFEGVNDDEPLVAGEGQGAFTETASLVAGEYTYYCSIAGHRAAGMEGQIRVR
ncbi:plastocyanin/azurin family copper-binding protein [Euzebya tangerina]|uniref:plastocyanin/azurin family copper-binding protein n=1 Tax=Euzebya tangerina TaxID=591198 RepID=UPI00196A97F0|nr:plastocyanin/azurin family copper-binding protein [Euzebya tangerina]